MIRIGDGLKQEIQDDGTYRTQERAEAVAIAEIERAREAKS